MTVIKYRIAAKILSSPTGRAWLTSQKKLPAIGPKTAGMAVASKEIMDLVSEEFENEPELKKVAINELERINAEYFERLEEDKKYNQRVMRNYQPIEEANRQSIQRAMGNIPSPAGKEATAVERPVVNRPSVQPLNEVNEASNRFAGANMFSPVGMGRSIDPNTMARGQINQTTKDRGREVFGPFDPVFASKGGIMSTNKAFQRVA